MAGSNLTLLSGYYTDQSGLSSYVFHWMRTIAFVLYALRPCFRHLMYFVLPQSSCVSLKIKCQSFQASWGYFICLLFLLLHLLKYPSHLCTLAYNTALFHSFQSVANVLVTKQHFHHHRVPEGLGIFHVPYSSRFSWSLHLFLGHPTFLCPLVYIVVLVLVVCLCPFLYTL